MSQLVLSFFLPHVLQKNIGLFSSLSQLAHLGNSSQVDSTRNRSKWSEGGSEWPSRRGVNFLKKMIFILYFICLLSFLVRSSTKIIKSLIIIYWICRTEKRTLVLSSKGIVICISLLNQGIAGFGRHISVCAREGGTGGTGGT